MHHEKGVIGCGHGLKKVQIPLKHYNISAHFFNEKMNDTNEEQDYLFRNKTT